MTEDSRKMQGEILIFSPGGNRGLCCPDKRNLLPLIHAVPAFAERRYMPLYVEVA